MNKKEIILILLSGILFGISFPPFSTNIIPFFALVPYLFLIYNQKSIWKTFRVTYFTFFIASLIALYWTSGLTHMRDPYLIFAGVALYFWQPAFFTLQSLLFFNIRKKYSTEISLLLFPLVWVTFEWVYAYGEFAFPWLTFGNSMTYDLQKIQFAEVTGVYGISLWVLYINSFIYYILLKYKTVERYGLKKYLILISFLVIFYLLPNFYNSNFKNEINSKDGIKIGIVQPNLDPWEKWRDGNSIQNRWQFVLNMLDVSKGQKERGVDISVWPETAIPFDLPSFNNYYFQFSEKINEIDLSILSGFADVKYYEKNAPITASSINDKIKYDSYNAILFSQPNISEIQTYSKMRLVPFAERVPYAEKVPWLIEPLRWGVGISNWARGTDSTIFYHSKSKSKFLSMICYESIFPEFVSSYVKKGAEFCIFITQDSWWGNTSGARQHLQISILRAIENRRWIVRCANGGISCFIDPYGNVYDKSEMFTTATLEKVIYPQTYKTFYSKNGDLIAIISVILTLLFFIYSIFKK
ncbi:MAG: apolipoprotein N-acyltransferase [Ignavibacteria bacterium]|nr:apolipoprotein N-acyltransferase [Bacteroidota bacterium]MSQ45396.1 apolipoprotein N-acyltransferase [Ignavibacteria bacterium]